jgi:hypothetical protein
MSENDLDALLGRVSSTDARRDLLQIRECNFLAIS